MGSSRQKSCTNCVKAKRRCDLGLPVCDRCLIRGDVCLYPWAVDPLPASQCFSASAVVKHTTVQPPWENERTHTIGCPSTQGVPSLFADLVNRDGIADPLASATSPTIQYALPPLLSEIEPFTGPIASGSFLQARLEYAARRMAEQPCSLVPSGQTGFIHHTQVATSAVLQDALAACALHSMRNSTNASLVRSEVARRAAQLISAMEAASAACPAVEMDLLPPVQALVLYQCIRLFSDHVSERAQAERDELWLRAWTARLREQVRPLGCEGSDWASWVREESVRRTVLVSEMLVGVYAFLKQGWVQGEARMEKLGFTAQTALWEARSVAEWTAIWARGPRLEVVLGSLNRFMRGASPDDVDSLGILAYATYFGLEALEEWLGGKTTVLTRWGLRP